MEILDTDVLVFRQRKKITVLTDSEGLFVITAYRFQLPAKVIDADNISIKNKITFLKLQNKRKTFRKRKLFI